MNAIVTDPAPAPAAPWHAGERQLQAHIGMAERMAQVLSLIHI